VRSDGPDDDRPDVVPVDPATGKKLPLHAFDVLESGDVFEVQGGAPPKDGRARAEAYVSAKVTVKLNGAAPDLAQVVRRELVGQLLGNPQLTARLFVARPIEIDLVPQGKSMAAFGFPKRVAERAAGLFWDAPDWSRARIGLLERSLLTERGLVVHEMAHAIARLAFTSAEQDAIYRLMLPVYRNRASVDEVFAIYSEREFVGDFTAHEGQAPGVYGLARRRWDERHVFTRFVRLLYHPHRPLAGSLRRDTKNLLG
jgi:hypothetical protein